ncbi:MAG: APC family permease [Frankiaceae bacterium]
MAEPSRETLSGHLRLPGAVALAVTIVVGSGVLVLPGIAYQQVGRSALLAWIGASVVMIPLLLVFTRLGVRYPGAAGVAGFVQAGFNRHLAAGVEVLLLETFSIGIPGIALAGGNYAAALLPGLSPTVAAALIVITSSSVVWLGVRLSTRVQIVLAVCLTAALLLVGTVGVLDGSPLQHAPDVSLRTVGTGLSAVGLIFFAFTGWEMVTFTTEEYVDPRRDFPRAVTIAYVTVVAMYVLLAWAVQTQLPEGDGTAFAAPIYEVVARISTAAVAHLTSALAVVIVVASLIGNMWAASRLVLSSAREGLLPAALTRVHAASGSPRRAVTALAVASLAILAANSAGGVSVGGLLAAAGGNFYVLYLLSALAFTRLFTGAARAYGAVVSLALAAVAVATYHAVQLACTLLFLAVGYLASKERARRRRRDQR